MSDHEKLLGSRLSKLLDNTYFAVRKKLTITCIKPQKKNSRCTSRPSQYITDDVNSLIPAPLLSIHQLLNSTWIDLLDGFHHNLMLNPGLVNLTLPEICSSTSNLEEPSGGAGNFLETLETLCQLVSDLAAEDWLQFGQLVSDLVSWSLSVSIILITYYC